MAELTLQDVQDVVSKAVDAAVAKFAAPPAAAPAIITQPAPETPAPTQKLEPGISIARAMKVLALGKGDAGRGVFEAKNRWGVGADGCPVLGHMSKALTAGNSTQAGNLISPVWMQEVLPLLRNMEVFGRVPGVRRVDVSSGSVTVRRQTAGGTFYYVGESQNITETTVTIGTRTLSAKKLTGLIPVSNDLLRQGPMTDNIVRDELLTGLRIKRDLSFLSGTGMLGAPLGVLSQVAAANTFAQSGTALTNVQTDYPKLIRLVEEANVEVSPSNSAFVMSARVKWGLYKLATTTGDMLFRDEVTAGRLFGFPIVTSEQIGTGTVLFVHGPSVWLGETLNMQLDAHDGAAYYSTADSATVSGYARDETVFRIIDEHDCALVYDVAASSITSVTLS